MLWKTFRSYQHCFMFRYPLFWKQLAHPDVHAMVVNMFGPEALNIIVGPCGPDYREPRNYAQQWIDENRRNGDLLELTGERSLLVGGVPGYEITYTAPAGVVHGKSSFLKNGYEYVLDYGTVESRYVRYEPVFRDIINSLRWF